MLWSSEEVLKRDREPTRNMRFSPSRAICAGNASW